LVFRRSLFDVSSFPWLRRRPLSFSSPARAVFVLSLGPQRRLAVSLSLRRRVVFLLTFFFFFSRLRDLFIFFFLLLPFLSALLTLLEKRGGQILRYPAISLAPPSDFFSSSDDYKPAPSSPSSQWSFPPPPWPMLAFRNVAANGSFFFFSRAAVRTRRVLLIHFAGQASLVRFSRPMAGFFLAGLPLFLRFFFFFVGEVVEQTFPFLVYCGQWFYAALLSAGFSPSGFFSLLSFRVRGPSLYEPITSRRL